MSWLLVIIGIVLAIFLLTVFFGAPYVPSRKRDLKPSFDELYNLGEVDLLVDLGSGDGVVLRQAANRGARAVGYEINPLLVLLSRFLSRKHPKVSVRLANYLKQDLPEQTTIVYIFGEKYHIGGTIAWLEKQARLIDRPLYVMSYGFELQGLNRIRQLNAHFLYKLEPLQSRKPQV